MGSHLMPPSLPISVGAKGAQGAKAQLRDSSATAASSLDIMHGKSCLFLSVSCVLQHELLYETAKEIVWAIGPGYPLCQPQQSLLSF